jgi:lipopolysaccharide export system permease protein
MSANVSMFGRYVFGQATAALLLILGSLSGVVWIALALKQLKLVTSEGQDSWTLLKMTTLALPNLMVMIAPIALLIAVIHILNRLNGDSELIVFNAAGASPWSIARPLLILALVVAVAVSAVNHFVMPWSSKLLRQYVIQVRTDLISQVLQPGRFSSPADNLTIHLRERTPTGELRGILMHDARKPKSSTTYLAERGNIVKQGDTAFLVMREGHIISHDDPNSPPRIVALDTYTFDIADFQAPGQVTEVKPRELYLHEFPVERAKLNLKNVYHRRLDGLFRAELHERFSSPFYPFAFVLIAVAFVGQAQSTRQNRTEATIAAFAVAVGLRIAGMAANNTVALNAAAVPLLYLLPLGGTVLGAILVQRMARPLKRSRLALAIDSAYDFAGRLLRRKPPEVDAPDDKPAQVRA